MQNMTYDEMQIILTYLMRCQVSGAAQQALSRRFREQWEQGDGIATDWLVQELRAVRGV